MFYHIALYTSFVIFVLGTIYKVAAWFRYSIGIGSDQIRTSARVKAAIGGTVGAIFSPRLLTLIKVFVVDVVFQVRVLRENLLRWIMHMLIYVGFMALLIMHAMDGIITQDFFPDYSSTLNPFMFLRDLFGFMVIVGIGIAVCRRIVIKTPRLRTLAVDRYAISILAVIMLSGIFLEAIKITSYSRYGEMVEEYADSDDEDELLSLEAYWVEHFELASPTVKGRIGKDVMAQGAELHEGSCAGCHSKPAWAFTGYAVAKIIKPVALGLDRARIREILLYIHFLACLFGLAYLPFSKMFHILASPVSLLANGIMNNKRSDPRNIATRQVMELDACTHCGTCTRRCSVAVAFHMIGNITLLPSEKMVFLKNYVTNKGLDDAALRTIQEGVYLCTNCDRCTVVCPVGINLRELWMSVKEEMIRKGDPVPLALSQFSFYRGVDRQALNGTGDSHPVDRVKEAVSAQCELVRDHGKVVLLTPLNKRFKDKADHSLQANSYVFCFSCENCTTVCPVVENYENPEEVLGLLPHQIMRSLGLGVRDLALGSRMLWDCVTCYQCQEHCPQGVKVTDVLYELKNLAIKETLARPGMERPQDNVETGTI